MATRFVLLKRSQTRRRTHADTKEQHERHNHHEFHGNFFVLLNLAVGGAYTGITNISGITALKEGEKAAMYIDWIKIIETK